MADSLNIIQTQMGEIEQRIVTGKANLENALPHQKRQVESMLRALFKRWQGLMDKAKNYGKEDNVFKVEVKVKSISGVIWVNLIYCNVYETEIPLLVTRDIGEMELMKIGKISHYRTGKIYSKIP